MNKNNHFRRGKGIKRKEEDKVYCIGKSILLTFRYNHIAHERSECLCPILRKFDCVDINKLREHEEVNSTRLKELIREIKKDKILKKPIAVDKNTNIILDGHHRLEAIRKLGLNKIPVVFVDYKSPKIKVFSWGENKKLAKKLIIKAGLSGKKLPPKTSKHMIKLNDELAHISLLETEVNVPLEKLMADNFS